MTIANNGGWTPLNAASVKDHVKVVELLLEKDADMTTANNGGWTPLYAASLNGHLEVVKLLLEKGADLDVCDNAGLTPLSSASLNGYVGIMKLLIHKSNEHHVDFHGRTALHLAAKSATVEAFEYAFGQGIDPTMMDEKGDSLLNYASSGGSLSILNAVFDNTAVSLIQSRHWSPLHWACRVGSFDVVERLLKEGFRGECITLPGSEIPWSPVSIAFFHGNEKMLENISASHRQLLEVRTDSSPVRTAQHCGMHHSNVRCDGCFHVSIQLQIIQWS